VDDALVGVLGTTDRAGEPHLTAIWYIRKGEELLFVTPVSSRKISHIRAHPLVELCINAGPAGPCVTARGPATIRGEVDEELLRELAARYLGPDGGRRYLSAREPGTRSVVVAIQPRRWRSWGIPDGVDAGRPGSGEAHGLESS
jgi:PPOX class probable F420-dependent enzyme